MKILDKLTKDIFSKHLGEMFHIELASSNIVSLELIQAIVLNAKTPQTYQDQPNNGQQREAFSIVFLGPQEPALAQGMYDIEHDGMGHIKGLFIAPVGIDARGRYYEAVFN